MTVIFNMDRRRDTDIIIKKAQTKGYAQWTLFFSHEMFELMSYFRSSQRNTYLFWNFFSLVYKWQSSNDLSNRTDAISSMSLVRTGPNFKDWWFKPSACSAVATVNYNPIFSKLWVLVIKAMCMSWQLAWGLNILFGLNIFSL